jgi:hypothetical protein
LKKITLILVVIFTITTNLFTQIITTPTTWNGATLTITGDITILGSGSLTLNNCTIYMPPNARIIALVGAKVILNNTTLTNSVANTMWGGVYVYGNSSLHSNHASQNGVQMTGGKIENAECGIVAYTNAYVRTYSGAHFYNNKIGVWCQPIYASIAV